MEITRNKQRGWLKGRARLCLTVDSVQGTNKEDNTRSINFSLRPFKREIIPWGGTKVWLGKKME